MAIRGIVLLHPEIMLRFQDLINCTNFTLFIASNVNIHVSKIYTFTLLVAQL
jgi:hypothetical protein